jgi:2-C-methyl-D-erythritol 4-phosphate cytidylyltransferase
VPPNLPQPAPPVVGLIVVAAGTGQRLGHGIPKARVLCGGLTLLEHALDAVSASGVAAVVVVVLPPGDAVLAAVVEAAAGAAPRGSQITSVSGGASRVASVRAGLAALPPAAEIVLVHDAARALTPPAVFQRVAAAVRAGAPAVIPVVPVADTVKVVRADVVESTPDRAGLRAVQTPQGFDAASLRSAHGGAAAADPGITDDAMLMEAHGVPVRVVDGDPLAFKVTTPLDLTVAEAVLALRRDGRGAADPSPSGRSTDVPE